MQTSTIDNMFETATRSKLRFASSRGELSVEQLWDVPLRARTGDDFNLDAVAKAANKVLKGLTEESFVSTERTPAVARAETALELIKYVIATKLAEEKAAAKRAKRPASASTAMGPSSVSRG